MSLEVLKRSSRVEEARFESDESRRVDWRLLGELTLFRWLELAASSAEDLEEEGPLGGAEFSRPVREEEDGEKVRLCAESLKLGD